MEETSQVSGQVDAIQAPAVDDQKSQAEETVPQTSNQIEAEAPQEAEQSQTETPEAPTAEAPVEEAPVEADEDYQPYEIPEYQAPNFDITQFADENGNLDVHAVNQAMSQQFAQAVQQSTQMSTSQIRFEMQEKAEWDKAVSAHPELAKDPSLRNLVHQLRAGSVIENNGKNYLSPKQAADKLFGLRGAGVQEGVKQAQTQTRVQESAYLETSDTTADPSASRRQQIKQRMGSRDYREREAATRDLLKEVSGNLLDQTLNQR